MVDLLTSMMRVSQKWMKYFRYIVLCLLQLTWRVDKNQDRPNAERGLDYLEELVKLGIVRGTLIVNSQQDYADVYINSGVRRCADEDEDV